MCVSAIFLRTPKPFFAQLSWLSLCLVYLSGCAATRPGVELPDISNWESRQEVLGIFPFCNEPDRLVAERKDPDSELLKDVPS